MSTWHPIVGSLRRRFFVLLALLGLVSLVPVLVGLRARARLAGRARQLDVSGSLRYRLMLVALEAEHGRADAVDAAVAEQRAALVSLIDGDPAQRLPACSTATPCERLRAHLARWDDVIAPAVAARSARRDDGTALQAVLPEELARMNATVRLLHDTDEEEVAGLARIGWALGGACLVLMLAIGYGVWEVFVRIRRLQEAARPPADEARIHAQALGHDEVAALARTLEANVRDLRRHAEEQLALLAGLGRLLAHEARNPLNNLRLTLNVMERALARLAADGVDVAALADKLERLHEDLTRLDGFVGDFLRLPLAVNGDGGDGARQHLEALRDDTHKKLSTSLEAGVPTRED